MRGEGERAHSEGVLFLTNFHQFNERAERSEDDEPDAITAVLGPKPAAQKQEQMDFAERIARRSGRLLVVNDEAHHTHDEGSEWNAVIQRLHEETPLVAQLDFSATPRFSKSGTIFPWTISDYPLKQAIIEGVVKRPMKGIARIEPGKSEYASVKYRGYLSADVECWKEYRDQLTPWRRKTVLFIMMNDTKDADDVADWLAKAYPAEFGDGKMQTIHTKNFFFQAEDGIRDRNVTGVQTCALPIYLLEIDPGFFLAIEGHGDRAIQEIGAPRSKGQAAGIALGIALGPLQNRQAAVLHGQIGRASCRGRVWMSV